MKSSPRLLSALKATCSLSRYRNLLSRAALCVLFVLSVVETVSRHKSLNPFFIAFRLPTFATLKMMGPSGVAG